MVREMQVQYGNPFMPRRSSAWGSARGKLPHAVVYHPKWQISVVVHGDDLTALGTPDMLDLYEAALQQNVDVKIRGRLGGHEDDLKEIRVLNRTIRVTSQGLTWEADPRDVELLSRSLGVENSRLITTPGVKYNSDGQPIADKEEEEIDSAELADINPDLDNVVNAVVVTAGDMLSSPDVSASKKKDQRYQRCTCDV